MAYMNPALFFKIIVPLLEMRQTVLVAISTLVDTWNFFSRLMELKYEDGTSVFDVLPQRMVCDRCIERQEEKCQHNMHLIPPWKSREKHDMARLIYGDDVQALKRESLGIVDNDSGGLFNAARIKSMLTADRVRWEDSMAPPPRFVFVACDPNGGGANHMAMVALVRDASRIVIVGAESKNVGVDEQEGMLVDFVSRVRGHPWLRDSWIIYFCENNGVGASQAYRHSALLSQQFERVYCVRDIIKGVKKYGVHTSEERKIEYATEIRMQLNMGTLYFMRDFICNSSTGGKECDPARWVINELAAEMKRARIIPSKGAANHVTVSPRFQWTAKCREDGTINKDLSDDVLLALCMALHFSTCFLGHALGAVEYEKFD